MKNEVSIFGNTQFITIFGNTQFREFTAVLPCGISGPNTRLRPPELQHCTQHCTLHCTLHSESAVRTALFDFALHSDCTRTALSDLSHTLAYIPSANYSSASLQLLASSHSFTYLGHVSRSPWSCYTWCCSYPNKLPPFPRRFYRRATPSPRLPCVRTLTFELSGQPQSWLPF